MVPGGPHRITRSRAITEVSPTPLTPLRHTVLTWTYALAWRKSHTARGPRRLSPLSARHVRHQRYRRTNGRLTAYNNRTAVAALVEGGSCGADSAGYVVRRPPAFRDGAAGARRRAARPRFPSMALLTERPLRQLREPEPGVAGPGVTVLAGTPSQKRAATPRSGAVPRRPGRRPVRCPASRGGPTAERRGGG
jgi:hypothetical protein